MVSSLRRDRDMGAGLEEGEQGFKGGAVILHRLTGVVVILKEDALLGRLGDGGIGADGGKKENGCALGEGFEGVGDNFGHLEAEVDLSGKESGDADIGSEEFVENARELVRGYGSVEAEGIHVDGHEGLAAVDHGAGLEEGDRGGYIKEDGVVGGLDGSEEVNEGLLAADGAHEHGLGLDGVAAAAEDIDGGMGGDDAIFQCISKPNEMRQVAGWLESERHRYRALRIGVDDEDTFAFAGEMAGEGERGGGLADAAALIGNDQLDHPSFSSATNWRMRSTSCAVQRRYLVTGWRFGSAILPWRSQL